jgi:hypothetical protein
MKTPRKAAARRSFPSGGPRVGTGIPNYSNARNIPRRRTGSQREFLRFARLDQLLRLMAAGHLLRRQRTPTGDCWTVRGDRVPSDIAQCLFTHADLEVADPGLFADHDLAQTYRLRK